MENPNLTKQKYRDTAALAFTDLRPQLQEKRFDVPLLNVGAGGMGKDQIKSSLMLPLHAFMVPQMSTIKIARRSSAGWNPVT